MIVDQILTLIGSGIQKTCIKFCDDSEQPDLRHPFPHLCKEDDNIHPMIQVATSLRLLVLKPNYPFIHIFKY